MKKTVVILILVAVVALSATVPHLMISPGALTRGHADIEDKCMDCHRAFGGVETARCIHCHQPEEIGMDSTGKKDTLKNMEMALFHNRLKDQACTSCHADHRGREPRLSVDRFDHDVLSADMKKACTSCHVQPSDQLHRQVPTTCYSCHHTTSWKFSGTFDHDLITGVSKTACHSCHLKPEDRFHQQLQESCDQCHTVKAWKPATFDHGQYFVLDRHHNDKCVTCHTTPDYKAYTCYGCHEHSEGKIREEHLEEGISDFRDCASCHRSGDKHDLRNTNRQERGRDRREAEGVRNYLKSHHEHERDEH